MEANDISRRTYQKSFLKNIQSVFSYDSMPWTVGLRKQIVNLLESKGFKSNSDESNTMVQCSKNSIAVVVTEKGVVLSMDSKDYISFEHYIGIFADVFGVFEVVGCSEIKNFIFQKLNLYRIGLLKNGKKPSREEAFGSLFSKEICKCSQAVTRAFPDYFYSLQPGFNEFDDHVVAKLLISAMRVRPIPLNNLKDELKQVNDEMYRQWFTATTDKVKDIMSK